MFEFFKLVFIIIYIFMMVVLFILFAAALHFKRKILKKIVSFLIIILFSVGSLILYDYLTHSEGNVIKLFNKNRYLYEEVVEIVLTKEPYLSTYKGDNIIMEISEINGEIIECLNRKEIPISDPNMVNIFEKIKSKCFVSRIFVFKNEIKFQCPLYGETIIFIYTPKNVRRRLQDYQIDIDDYWYIDVFIGE